MPENKNKKVAWTLHQRRILLLIWTRFEFSPSVRAEIFNLCFPEAQRPLRAISAQYAEIKRLDKRHADWTTLTTIPLTPVEELVQKNAIDHIQRVAAQIASTVTLIDDNVMVESRRGDATTTTHSPTTLASNKRPISDSSVVTPPGESIASNVKRTRRQTIGVTFTSPPGSIDLQVSKETTRSKSIKSKRSKEKAWLHRRQGGVFISKNKMEQAMATPEPVPAQKAHRPLPTLLYRTWDEHSQGQNSVDGFIAGRFIYNNYINRAPKSTEIQVSDTENHVGNNPIASPFISTCSGFVWVIRKALKEMGKGRANMRLTVIDSSKIDKHAIFHLVPFHQELKKKYLLKNGAWHYGGRLEHLIWGEVPAEAVVHTIEVQQLLKLSSQVPALSKLLRLSVLQLETSFEKIFDRFKTQNVDVDSKNIPAMALLSKYLGVSAMNPSHIEHIIRDIVQGFGLQILARSTEQWVEAASIFAHAFAVNDLRAFQESGQVMAAFLYGVQAGIGDFNTLHDAKKIRVMMKRASNIGLDHPVGIVLSKQRTIAQQLNAYDQEQQSRYAAAEAASISPPTVRERRRAASSNIYLTPPTSAEEPVVAGSANDVHIAHNVLGDEDEIQYVYSDYEE